MERRPLPDAGGRTRRASHNGRGVRELVPPPLPATLTADADTPGVLSLDVFDTGLVRTVRRPEALFLRSGTGLSAGSLQEEELWHRARTPSTQKTGSAAGTAHAGGDGGSDTLEER